MTELPPGYVRVLLERSKDSALASAARAIAAGESPARSMERYVAEKRTTEVIIDLDFGALPIGSGGGGAIDFAPEMLDPDKSDKFLVRAFIPLPDGRDMPERIGDDPLYSDPLVGAQLLCDNSRPLAIPPAKTVLEKLDTPTLHAKSNGLDGAGVAIAIMDTGIYHPRSGGALDVAYSYRPLSVFTSPGMNRIGHGTMCAYDALIAAPNATLLDMPILRDRAYGDHAAQGTVSAAMRAYYPLIVKWRSGTLPYKALVVNNSWGILHPSLDLPAPHPQRYIDNPKHIFRLFVSALVLEGADVLFAASNCGQECPSAVCLDRRKEMIMGANAYDEVLTLAGCDLSDARVGYSSQGPSIPMMPPQKPDLTAYTHFIGSKVYRNHVPDGGTSAACAVAAGCVAALRTRLPPATTSPASLIATLKATARKVAGPGWNSDYGHGIIRPVDAARSLGLIP